MASPDAQAKQTFQTLKLRKALLKQIDNLRTEGSNGTNLSHFDTIGEILEQYRLGCVSTIFIDFKYAVSEKVDDMLWQVHANINTEFRRILGRLKHNSHVVERRKVESKYNNFLRVAQQFYKGYIQRLNARYDIPELHRVAQGLDTDQMPSVDKIVPGPLDLGSVVLKSCYDTLIHLGDLARYRAQARNKKSGFETALTCYSLAHDLIPQSGYAFHQMGIINLDGDNHLEVVYLFYRARAVKDPHPNAKQNLEAKFKTLQATHGTPRGKSSAAGPPDAFIMWFLRLHALFYKGAPMSSQQSELDKEVMHRLAMALKDPASAPVLFKMSLVNMAAFSIALDDYSASNTANASRFCQFILTFNIRFICKLCEALEVELKDAYKRRKENQPNAPSGPEDSVTSPLVEAFLPILRVYSMWLAAHRQEIFSAGEALDSVLPSMLRSFTTVFTFLTVEATSHTDLSTCPYLLPEDLDIRGLRSFDEDQATPVSIRTHCTEDGKLKPHLKQQSDRLSPQRECGARILDSLRCVYQLADDDTVPLVARVADDWLIFEYQPQGQTRHAQQIERELVSSPSAGILVTDSKVADGENSAPIDSPSASVLQSSNDLEGIPDSRLTDQSNDQFQSGLNDADKTVVNMLSPFLEDPAPEAGRSMPLSAEPSYGMHSSTANELAQELLAQFKPEQDTATKRDQSAAVDIFGSRTWDWKYPRTATTPGAPDANAAPTNGFFSRHGSNRSSRTSLPAPDSLEDPFSSPNHRPTSALHSRQMGNVPNATAARPTISDDSHRSQLLQVFTNTGARRSPSSPWATGSWVGESRNAAAPENSPWGSGDQRRNMQLPTSSNASAFTNVSSLYHGTPSTRPPPGITGYAMPRNEQSYDNGARENNPPAFSRHLQMDDTASNYDAAVFQAAWQGSGKFVSHGC
jgi:protein SMG7